MICPICGKNIIESLYFDEVACSDPKCKFNTTYEVIEGYNIDIDIYEYWIKEKGTKEILATCSNKKIADKIINALNNLKRS
jgi:hypothetical protein